MLYEVYLYHIYLVAGKHKKSNTAGDTVYMYAFFKDLFSLKRSILQHYAAILEQEKKRREINKSNKKKIG